MYVEKVDEPVVERPLFHIRKTFLIVKIARKKQEYKYRFSVR